MMKTTSTIPYPLFIIKSNTNKVRIDTVSVLTGEHGYFPDDNLLKRMIGSVVFPFCCFSLTAGMQVFAIKYVCNNSVYKAPVKNEAKKECGGCL
jgi:hypothetical protein